MEVGHPDVRVVTIGETGDYQDPGGEARSAYAPEGPALALIRPDGYIACTGDEAAVREGLTRLTRLTAPR